MMERRDFLKALALGGTALAAQANLIGQTLAQVQPPQFSPSNRDAVSFLLGRITFGATPDLYESVQRSGVEAFIEEQLNPESIDDSHMAALLEPYTLLTKSSAELGTTYRNNLGMLTQHLVASTVTRAIYSRRSLYEMMVHFWSDHFSVYTSKLPVLHFKFAEDREIIRPHALGKFRDLLVASAHSPAMLVYLDNAQSEAAHPNENYAREMLELHTLGVHGGYTEADIKEVARIFTGWSLIIPEENAERMGEFIFRPFSHDNGTKTVLGETFSNDGELEGIRLLNMLASQPATARHIATKLVKRFVGDFPPESLVTTVAQTYLETDGDIKALLRTIFMSEEFWAAPPKFKRPLEYLTSVLRALDYQVGRQSRFERAIGEWLQTTGHVPFAWPAPNGYPDMSAYWMQNLLPRWNLALAASTSAEDGQPNFERLRALADASNYQALDFIAQYFLGRAFNPDENRLISEFMNAIEGDNNTKIIATIALVLASPAFQYR